jgi:pyruvate dehydrogenase phosphatase
VEKWLNRFNPTDAVDNAYARKAMSQTNYLLSHEAPKLLSSLIEQRMSILGLPVPRRHQSKNTAEDTETFLDERSGQVRWKAQEKHFVVEDDHCGVHLVKNALGGSRRGLFESAMTLKPPLSQNIRADIVVSVMFFDDKQQGPFRGADEQ